MSFTAATRLTSDFFLKVRITHFTYAAAKRSICPLRK